MKLDLEEIVQKADKLVVTKRNILSTLAKVFDPMDIISPIVLQEVCVLLKGWDEEIEGELRTQWVAWLAELKKVGEIIFNRCLYQSVHGEVLQCWLHGFGDANQRAYCAMVYLTPGISSDIRCVLKFTCCKTASGTREETNHTQTGAHLSENFGKTIYHSEKCISITKRN